MRDIRKLVTTKALNLSKSVTNSNDDLLWELSDFIIRVHQFTEQLVSTNDTLMATLFFFTAKI
jgi:hypothetical protein